MKKITRRPQLGELKENWYIVDAGGQTLGRLASKIVKILIGKDTPNFDPSVINKAKVIVINAAQIRVTGNKFDQKRYYRHSGYPGGLKVTPFSELMKKKPTEVIKKAVSGMLPKNKLRRGRLNNLKIYKDDQHLHQGQKPVKIEL